MKTAHLPIYVLAGCVAFAGQSQGANTYTRLAPGSTGDASRSFTVQVDRLADEKKGECLRFNVTARAAPGKEPFSPTLMADLEVFDGEMVVSSSALQAKRQGDVVSYSFVVAAKFAKDSKFSLGEVLHAPGGEPLPAANYYWFTLQDFARAK